MADDKALAQERVARFLVSNEVLKTLLHMPADAVVYSVCAADSPHGAFWVKVAHRDLPMADVNDPPEISPVCTEHRVQWDWNLKEGAA